MSNIHWDKLKINYNGTSISRIANRISQNSQQMDFGDLSRNKKQIHVRQDHFFRSKYQLSDIDRVG